MVRGASVAEEPEAVAGIVNAGDNVVGVAVADPEAPGADGGDDPAADGGADPAADEGGGEKEGDNHGDMEEAAEIQGAAAGAGQ